MSVADETTFLCGYQRIRRYGSTNDLRSSAAQTSPVSRYIIHHVQPSDTLQGLVLKYNSSMHEIKRINKLWSNNSLHCKSTISVPLFEVDSSTNFRSHSANQQRVANEAESSDADKANLKPANEEEETVENFLRRIDHNVRKTKKAVRKLKSEF